MLTGKHRRTLDDKGRLALPPVFRPSFADGVFVGRQGGCLGMWTQEEIEATASRIKQQVRDGHVSQDALRRFASSIEKVMPDGQGRISISADLRAAAGLDKSVIVIGAFDRAEVWDADTWEGMESDAEPNEDIESWL